MIDMFQFHNGSIKRPATPPPVLCPVLGFNSTMVRLKVAKDRLVKSIRYQFQFHNGSIKRLGYIRHFDDKTVFQFHNGSIKSTQPSKKSFILTVSIPQWFD